MIFKVGDKVKTITNAKGLNSDWINAKGTITKITSKYCYIQVTGLVVTNINNNTEYSEHLSHIMRYWTLDGPVESHMPEWF